MRIPVISAKVKQYILIFISSIVFVVYSRACGEQSRPNSAPRLFPVLQTARCRSMRIVNSFAELIPVTIVLSLNELE